MAIETLTLFKVLLICAVFLCWTLRIQYLPKGQVLFYLSIVIAFVVENAAMYISAGMNTTAIYYWYLILEFVLLMIMGAMQLKRLWSTTLAISGGFGYFVVLTWESVVPAPIDLISARSVMLGYCLLTLMSIALLMDLVERSTNILWKEQRFWTYFSIFIFVGPAIPFVGLLNHIYGQDPSLAEELFIIIDVLFFFRYGSALVAGWLLRKEPFRS